MKVRNLFLSLLMLLCASSAFAQMDPPVPVDTAFRIGKLPNGLTYFIRHNNWPEHRANFYIAQKVGSIEENEDQRGLAHFLEHMAFNGSDHFKGNDLIEWCRAHGIEFGADLNAYTSIDQTVYNIDNVPTQNASALDSCLLILRDWSCGLSLEQSEIDKERGVIHEEWRLRTSPNSRMLERNLEKLYPGSKYGRRYPIGLMSVVDNFKRKELVDYYHKWYHPNHQGIIVIGDVDVDKTEAEIKRLFGDIKNPANEAPLVNEAVPDNDKPIVVIDKDKEFQQSVVMLMMKHDVYPDSLKQRFSYLMTNYVKDAAISMLGTRFNEAALKADCPFVGADASDDNYLLSKTKDAFGISVLPKNMGLSADALKAAYLVVKQAAQYGFTATEYARFKENQLSALDKAWEARDKRPNSQFYGQALDYFLNNEPMPSLENTYQMMKQVIPMIPLEAVNGVLPELLSKSDTNLVIISFNNEKDGAVYPTEEQLLNAVHEARAEEVKPYVDNVKQEPLIKQLPKAGKIKKEIKSKQFGYNILKLSNGVTVLLKKTDYKKDQVSMSGTGGQGSSVYGQSDAANLNVFDDVIDNSGLGDFSSIELGKALAGKIANAKLTMDERRMSIGGSSTPKDVETMLQLTYLYFTNIRKDNDAFNNLMQQYELTLKNRALSPETALGDTLTNALYPGQWRVKPQLIDDLGSISYDRILQMAKERTANANGWVFEIIGNYNDSTIRPLICQYLGALPSKGKNTPSERVTRTTSDNVDKVFTRKMETPKANSYVIWLNTKMPWSQEHALQANIAGQIMSMIYLKKIREEASAAYTCGAQGSFSMADDGYHIGQLIAYCPMKPEKKDIAIKIMNEQMDSLGVTCDKEMLEKVQKAMLKSHESAVKTNGYWQDIVWTNYIFGRDDDSQYLQLVKSQTPEKISAFVKEFLASANKVSVVMLPQDK
ncbi:MAG: insulinase family protein [Prevotella sp.]|nr:insulinase family protein [Prevotella sp.]